MGWPAIVIAAVVTGAVGGGRYFLTPARVNIAQWPRPSSTRLPATVAPPFWAVPFYCHIDRPSAFFLFFLPSLSSLFIHFSPLFGRLSRCFGHAKVESSVWRSLLSPWMCLFA